MQSVEVVSVSPPASYELDCSGDIAHGPIRVHEHREWPQELRVVLFRQGKETVLHFWTFQRTHAFR